MAMDEANDALRPIDRSQHELLIVDDNPASRYATVRLLRGAGFRTREAATGAEGLRAVDETISAMVLDVHLPDIDGFELCRLLHSRPATARLPVLHLTAAFVTDEDKVRGLDSGADAYLTRPVEPAVLVATVQALVRTRIAEEAMRRSEIKFRAIYSQAPGGICLLNRNGEFIDANPAMLKFLRRDLPAIVGHRVTEFVPKEWVQRVDAYTRQLGSAGTPHEFPLIDPKGELVHLEWAVSPHIEPDVNMAVVSDVSARILLEQQRQQLLDRERVARGAAERMSRMKDDLIAVLSHELRTPLNAIMSWTHVLKLRGGSEETMRGLAAIERNGNIQARMISDILDMSRFNLGKMRLTLETVDPAESVTSAINAMRPATDAGGHRFVLDFEPPYRPIHVDSSRLQQILWNLLSNAIKFSPPGSEIRVALRQQPDGLRISVADQGRGIDPEFLPYLFDRFTQSDAASNREHGGLGLGLSIVKQLVEAHGGTVAARSEGSGRGSVFEVWLPVDGASGDEQQRGPASAFDGLPEVDRRDVPLEGLNLLVVDDDREACAMLQIILGEQGAIVVLAYDYAGALRVLDTLSPDLVVSDIGMPGKDGYELVREIRRREALAVPSARIPTVALTSFTRPQDEVQAKEAGFDRHCPKPLKPLQLIQLIRQLTGRA
jgi:PAS domain S-box-containing protein